MLYRTTTLCAVWKAAWSLSAGSEDGQDIVEYAFLAGLISIVAVGLIVLLGPYLQNAFGDVINAVNSA